MEQKSMYWAGPRCFVASLRHFDLECIRILQNEYSWIVYYPVQLVKEAINSNQEAVQLGRNGLIRKTCLEYLGKSDIVVAYTGLIWDTGTAREVEFAVTLEKPVLAWSDSSVIYSETFEKENGTVSGVEIEKLKTMALPFNVMDLVFNKYIRLNKLYTSKLDKCSKSVKLFDYDLNEQELAKKINTEARKILHIRSSKTSRKEPSKFQRH